MKCPNNLEKECTCRWVCNNINNKPMKIYFKEAISKDEFDYLIKNFDWGECIKEETEIWTIYKEVMIETKWKYIDNKEWKVIEWFLKDWYILSWSRTDMKYYLK